VGKVNGFGGKVNDTESVEAAALREMEEESGVILEDAELISVLLYDYPLKNSTMEVYVYRATKWSGNVTESEEMTPVWIDQSELNFTKMWADDPFWMNKLLNLRGSKFVGWFDFSEDMEQVTRCQVEDVCFVNK